MAEATIRDRSRPSQHRGSPRALPINLAIAITLGSACASAPTPAPPPPYDRIVEQQRHRSLDGRTLRFAVLGFESEPRGRTLAVYDSVGGSWPCVFLDADRGFHPWSLAVCELDGDPLPELAVGVHKRSRHDPVLRNRIFIFDWRETDVLFAKWLGSRLGDPIEQFAFEPGPDGRDRLCCRQIDPEGRAVTRRFVWNGFGFDLEAEIASREPVKSPSPPCPDHQAP